MRKEILSTLLAGFCVVMSAQNPVIRNQFTADPTARVFGNTLYLYCSHDIPAPDDYPRKDWFCMHDYHVFSTTDLVNWHDYGVQFTEDDVSWVKRRSYSMWAPDCVFANGKYLLYFPAVTREAEKDEIFGVGIAESDKPCGPFHPRQETIKGINGIDPCVFIDDDGKAYIYWAKDGLHGARLKANMSQLDGEDIMLAPNTEGAYKEGPFVFNRNGIYYLTYPLQVTMDDGSGRNAECLAYATGKSPLGPFEYNGRLMDVIPEPYCWTNHHSIVKFKGQWYLFYHHNDYDPKMEMHRSVSIDSLSFNIDGSIRKVIHTFRGVGVTNAESQIQIDRYSQLKGNGSGIAFVNVTQPFDGWYVRLSQPGDVVTYNTVMFNRQYRKMIIRYRSKKRSTFKVKAANQIISCQLPARQEWTTHSFSIQSTLEGIHDISLKLDKGAIDIDWIQFGT